MDRKVINENSLIKKFGALFKSQPKEISVKYELFINQNYYIKEKDIEIATNFLDEIYDKELLKEIKLPQIMLSKNQDEYKDDTIYITKKSAKNRGAETIIHEYIHHLAMHDFPFVKYPSDCFLAKTVSLAFLRFANYSSIIPGDLAYLTQMGERFYEKEYLSMEALALEINKYLKEASSQEHYDLYELAMVIDGVIRAILESDDKGQASWDYIFELISYLGEYEYPAVEQAKRID